MQPNCYLHPPSACKENAILVVCFGIIVDPVAETLRKSNCVGTPIEIESYIKIFKDHGLLRIEIYT